MGKNVQTDFLFAQPSFASGVARVLDLWGQFDDYNRSEDGAEADAKAIAADWLITGQDMVLALQAEEVTDREKPKELELV